MIETDESSGTLYVKVLEGVDLLDSLGSSLEKVAASSSLTFFSTKKSKTPGLAKTFLSIAVQVGQERLSSSLIVPDAGGRCVWQEEFVFSHVGSVEEVVVVCVDGSTGRKRAHVCVPLHRLPEDHAIEQWYQLNSMQCNAPPIRSALLLRFWYVVDPLLHFSRTHSRSQSRSGGNESSIDITPLSSVAGRHSLAPPPEEYLPTAPPSTDSADSELSENKQGPTRTNDKNPKYIEAPKSLNGQNAGRILYSDAEVSNQSQSAEISLFLDTSHDTNVDTDPEKGPISSPESIDLHPAQDNPPQTKEVVAEPPPDSLDLGSSEATSVLHKEKEAPEQRLPMSSRLSISSKLSKSSAGSLNRSYADLRVVTGVPEVAGAELDGTASMALPLQLDVGSLSPGPFSEEDADFIPIDGLPPRIPGSDASISSEPILTLTKVSQRKLNLSKSFSEVRRSKNRSGSVSSALSQTPSQTSEMNQKSLPSGIVDYFLVVGPDQECLSEVPIKTLDGLRSTIQSTASPSLHQNSSAGPSKKQKSEEAFDEAVILERFPTFDSEDFPFPNKVEWFCFPDGLWLTIAHEQPTAQLRSFAMHVGQMPVYGICLHYWEPLQKTLGAYSVNDELRIWVPICICLLTRMPTLEPLKSWLKIAHKILTDDCKSASKFSSLEEYVVQLTLETPVPIPGLYDVSLEFFGERIEFVLPHTDQLPSAPYQLTPFFTTFGTRMSLKLWSLALCEPKLVFHSTKLAKLPIMCEALLTLLYPFQWVHPYVPVLPRVLVDYLQAPLPYILGLHSDWVTGICDEFLADVVLIDCDRGVIHMPETLDFPNLPESIEHQLARSVSEVLYPDIYTLDKLRLIPEAVSQAKACKQRATTDSHTIDRHLSPESFSLSLTRQPSVGELGENDSIFSDTNNSRTSITSLDSQLGANGTRSENSGQSHAKLQKSEAKARLEICRVAAGLLFGYTDCLFYIEPEVPIFNASRFLEMYSGEEEEAFLKRLVETQAFHMLIENQDAPRLKAFQMLMAQARSESQKLGLHLQRQSCAMALEMPTLSPHHCNPHPTTNTLDDSIIGSKKTKTVMFETPSPSFELLSLVGDVDFDSPVPPRRKSLAKSRPSPNTTASIRKSWSLARNSSARLSREYSWPHNEEASRNSDPLGSLEFSDELSSCSPGSKGILSGVVGLKHSLKGNVSREDALKNWAYTPMLDSNRMETLENDYRAWTVEDVSEKIGIDLSTKLQDIISKEQECLGPNIRLSWRQTQLSMEDTEPDSEDAEVLRLCLQRAFASEVLSEQNLCRAEKILGENKSMQEKFLKILQQPKVHNTVSTGPLLLHSQGFETLERLSRAVISAAIASEAFDIAVQLLHLTGQYYRVKEAESRMDLSIQKGIDEYATARDPSCLKYQTEFLSSKLGNQDIFTKPAVWMQVLDAQIQSMPDINGSSSSFYGLEDMGLESSRKNDMICCKAKCLLYEMKSLKTPYKEACAFLSLVAEKYDIDKADSENMEQKLRIIWTTDKSKPLSPVMTLASCPKRVDFTRRWDVPPSTPEATDSPFRGRKTPLTRRYSTYTPPNKFLKPEFQRVMSQGGSPSYSHKNSSAHRRSSSSLQLNGNLDMVDLMLNPVVPLPPTSSDLNFYQQRAQNHHSPQRRKSCSNRSSPLKKSLVGSLLDSIRFLKPNNDDEALMSGPITCISCSGTRLIAGDLNGRVCEYSTASNRLVHTFQENAGPISAILCTGDAILASSSDGAVRIWHQSTAATEVGNQKKGYRNLFTQSKSPVPKLFTEHSGPVQCLEQIPLHQSGNQLVASGSADKTICIWDTSSIERQTRFTGHQGPITCLYTSYHGTHLLSGSKDSSVRLWDAVETATSISNSVSALRVFKGHSGPITCVKQLGRQSAVSASTDRTVRFWDKRMRKSVAVLKGHTGPVTYFQDGGPDGTLLITGSADCTVRIWDMRHTSKGSIHICREHSERVTSILRKKTRILSSSEDSFLCEWDLNSGNLVKTYSTHNRGISCMSVSEATVITASFDASLRIWPRLNVERAM